VHILTTNLQWTWNLGDLRLSSDKLELLAASALPTIGRFAL